MKLPKFILAVLYVLIAMVYAMEGALEP